VAELALAFILALSRNIVAAHCEVFQKQSWPNVVGLEIGGKILGLLGFGNIARLLSEKAQCLGMKVMAHDPFIKRDDIVKAGVTPADFDEVFKEADFISVHVPLTSKTRNLIGERELRSMKRTSFLINTARGHQNLNASKFALLYQNDDAGKEGAQGVQEGVKKYGGSLVYSSSFPVQKPTSLLI